MQKRVKNKIDLDSLPTRNIRCASF